MKIIFLDIDGVLNNKIIECKLQNHQFSLYNVFDQEAMMNLKDIVTETNAYLVLSSSWRKSKDNLAIVDKQLAAYGLRVIGSTPICGPGCSRGIEILHYLDNCPFNIDSYIILDDEIDQFLPEQHDHLIHCSWERGLTAELASDAIDKLTENDKN